MLPVSLVSVFGKANHLPILSLLPLLLVWASLEESLNQLFRVSKKSGTLTLHMVIFNSTSSTWAQFRSLYQTSANLFNDISALYAVLFDETREAAFSLWNVLFGLGCVIVFGWSDFLNLRVKCYLLILLLVISLIGLFLGKSHTLYGCASVYFVVFSKIIFIFSSYGRSRSKIKFNQRWWSVYFTVNEKTNWIDQISSISSIGLLDWQQSWWATTEPKLKLQLWW